MQNLRFLHVVRLALVLAPVALLTACSTDDEPEPEEDNELITTVRYTLTPATGGAPITAEWKDVDGDGGANPTVGTLRLAPNTTYTATITLLDESKTPAENITDEISEEKEDHLFVYTPSSTGLLNVVVTDRDANNLPVGLTTAAQTGAAGSGSLRVVLRHQPGIKTGDSNVGDTDVDATFPVAVQ